LLFFGFSLHIYFALLKVNVYIVAKQMLFVNIKRGNTNDTLRTTRKRNDYNGYDFRCFAFYHDFWLCNFIACNMSEIIINIENMSEAEFAKTWDLLRVANVVAKDNNNPLQTSYHIAIDLEDNRHNDGSLDEALGYISKHIIT
jgi:hypothetical protein